MSRAPTPVAGTERQTASLAGVTSLLGRITALALMAAAGVAGWIAVDELDIGIAQSGNGAPVLAASLPELGGGLPEARLQSPPPWRQFALTYQDATQTNHFWIDLDSWQLRIESTNEAATTTVEVYGDRSFTRASPTAPWEERDVQATRDISSWLMTGIGPFVLTDLVPPNTLGFTTLELEGTSRGERVYEVSVDAATLLEQHPLAHERWVAATRLVNDTSGVYRIRVREDGYIARIDGETSSVQWDPLEGGVVFFSPLGQNLIDTPAAEPPIDPNATPAVPPAVPSAVPPPAD